LVARPREHGGRDIPDRPVHRAVRRERDHRAVVVPLDEPRSHDLCHPDRRVSGHGAGAYPGDAGVKGSTGTIAPVPTPPAAPGPRQVRPPQWTPPARELDDLELLTMG